jgi:hypothetical protein
MENVKRSGLSMEAYIRFLINGLIPKPNPPVDYFSMTSELRNIGSSMRQIASKATAFHMIDANELVLYSIKLNNQISAIQNAVELPYRRASE